MRLFNKKILATLAAAVTAVSVGSVFSTSASAATFLQGDVNGDGNVTSIDLVKINKYLSGLASAADANVVTRMDCDNDKAITRTDAYAITTYLIGTNTPSTVVRPVLTKPSSTGRNYCKYNLETKIETSYSIRPTEVIDNLATASLDVNNYQDTQNLNAVQLSIGSSGAVGSGFIVDDYVIATAAHCVTNKTNTSCEYVESITVNVYAADGVTLLDTANAIEVHIPSFYKTSTNGNQDAYDYALIRVDKDLSAHGVWDMGVTTAEFMETGADVTSTGFTDLGDGNGYRRYYSTGSAIPFASEENGTVDNPNRIQTEARCNGGKSGGPIYYETIANSATVKSVVGITTGKDAGDAHTWGVRMTPHVIQFYLNNSNI